MVNEGRSRPTTLLSSWPSTRASMSSLSRQQPMNKEYRPRLPQQGQIVVSPWPRPQHQYVKKRFFSKNHQTTGFIPPKTVLLRTTSLPKGYANHALLYRPMPYVFYC